MGAVPRTIMRMSNRNLRGSTIVYPAKTPVSSRERDYQTHVYIGNMCLALGDLAQAELEYSRAHAVMPTEAIRKQLASIRSARAGHSSAANCIRISCAA